MGIRFVRCATCSLTQTLSASVAKRVEKQTSGSKVCQGSRARPKTRLTNFPQEVKRLPCAMWFCTLARYSCLFLTSFLTFPVRTATVQTARACTRRPLPAESYSFTDLQSLRKPFQPCSRALSAGLAAGT